MRPKTIINYKQAAHAVAVGISVVVSFALALVTTHIITVGRRTASAPVATIGAESGHQASFPITLSVKNALKKKKVATVAHPASTNLLSVVNHPDIHENQRLIADDTLRSLPSYCRDNLKTLYVNYDANPKNRGLGGTDTIIVAGNVADDEFRALLVHECGHVTDLGGFRGTAQAGMTKFFDGNEPIFADDASVAFYRISWTAATQMKTKATKADFVSGYAMTDVFEDFAESFAYYTLQKDDFARLAKKNSALKAKFAWFEEHIGDVTPVIAMGKYVRGATEPWDATKLPYLWLN